MALCVGPPGAPRVGLAFAEEGAQGYIFGKSAVVTHDGEEVVLVLDCAPEGKELFHTV